MEMGEIIKGDFVVVNNIYHSDKSVGIEIGDTFEVQNVDVDGDILIELDSGSEWILTHNQVELVKDENNDYHALESAIREVDREIAQRALELEMLKEARDKMLKVLMMNGK